MAWSEYSPQFLPIKQNHPSALSHRQRMDFLQLGESEGACWDRTDLMKSCLFSHMDISSLSLHSLPLFRPCNPPHMTSGFTSTSGISLGFTSTPFPVHSNPWAPALHLAISHFLFDANAAAARWASEYSEPSALLPKASLPAVVAWHRAFHRTQSSQARSFGRANDHTFERPSSSPASSGIHHTASSARKIQVMVMYRGSERIRGWLSKVEMESP
jgi:hypothetical protein